MATGGEGVSEGAGLVTGTGSRKEIYFERRCR